MKYSKKNGENRINCIDDLSLFDGFDFNIFILTNIYDKKLYYNIKIKKYLLLTKIKVF